MTAQPHETSDTGASLPDKSLRSIRAALTLPQDRAAFDTGLRLALDEVRISLDLGKLTEFVHAWWLIACDSIHDRTGRELMYKHVAHVQELADQGRPLPRGDRTWREVLAERGVQT
ncbi:DUF6247 family protein [Streptosporangium sp. NBC_01639]|uniref:DUF6247 family protein n=1 Tax=Streptosporangium sp. NBC_01639 TaxID=2975948 RepID=UPI003869C403|nr:DUF6247 family protein [Streptosporangium sp. NBC_01639]